MRVRVKTVAGRPFEVEIDGAATVGALKALIDAQHGYDKSVMKLSAGKDALEDACRVSDAPRGQPLIMVAKKLPAAQLKERAKLAEEQRAASAAAAHADPAAGCGDAAGDGAGAGELPLGCPVVVDPALGHPCAGLQGWVVDDGRGDGGGAGAGADCRVRFGPPRGTVAIPRTALRRRRAADALGDAVVREMVERLVRRLRGEAVAVPALLDALVALQRAAAEARPVDDDMPWWRASAAPLPSARALLELLGFHPDPARPGRYDPPPRGRTRRPVLDYISRVATGLLPGAVGQSGPETYVLPDVGSQDDTPGVKQWHTLDARCGPDVKACLIGKWLGTSVGSKGNVYARRADASKPGGGLWLRVTDEAPLVLPDGERLTVDLPDAALGGELEMGYVVGRGGISGSYRYESFLRISDACVVFYTGPRGSAVEPQRRRLAAEEQQREAAGQAAPPEQRTLSPGDRVRCKTSNGWQRGTVRERGADGWAKVVIDGWETQFIFDTVIPEWAFLRITSARTPFERTQLYMLWLQGDLPEDEEAIRRRRRALVDALPTQTVGAQESGDCIVCFVPYEQGEELRCLPCGHRGHKECFDRWLVDQVATCPMCRADIAGGGGAAGGGGS